MGASVENYIIASRVAQGYDEIKNSISEEREDIIQHWNQLQQPKKNNKWWQSKDPAVKQAIKDSVAATSTGNTEQDARVQRAIESSIDQIQQASGEEGRDDEALERAIQASIQEASIGHDNEHIERQTSLALQRSLKQSDPGDDSDDDANIKEALRQSKIDGDLDEAMKRSLKDNEPNDEERIVMEYVKKQSLLEEQHRRNAGR